MPITIDSPRFDEWFDELSLHPVRKGRPMLYGSSFFTNWGYGRAREQLQTASGGALDIVNHGFGGACVQEMIHYYPRMVAPYAPSSVILRAGPNDVMSLEYTAEEVWQEILHLLNRLHADFPKLTVYILSVFDYPSCQDAWKPHYRALDELAAAQSAQNNWVNYLDIHPFFYKTAADIGRFENFRDVFVEDGLHMTDAAYEEFSHFFWKLLKPHWDAGQV